MSCRFVVFIKIVCNVSALQAEGIFAKRVNSSGVAFHSPYMFAAHKTMLKEFERIIPEAVERTECWISTSIAVSAHFRNESQVNTLQEEEWDTELAASSSAEYHANNLIQPVLFFEAIRKVSPLLLRLISASCTQIPRGAVAVEIAPHSLLQAPLKRGMQEGALQLGLMSSKSENVGLYLIEQLCRLHSVGAKINIDLINDPVQWPVNDFYFVFMKLSN